MKSVVLAAALALIAGAAHAQAADALRSAVYRSPASPVAALPAPMRSEAPALPRGVARTSIDHRFDRDVEGALGYLCGRKPDEIAAGAAGARGLDHDGRFLGVQLKISLR